MALKNLLTDIKEVHVSSKVYEATRNTEDGVPFTAECYFVEGETEDGFRFRHTRNFLGGANSTQEDGWTVVDDVRKEAMAEAQTLADRINAHLRAGGSLGEEHWRETHPVYGSPAYLHSEVDMGYREEDGW